MQEMEHIFYLFLIHHCYYFKYKFSVLKIILEFVYNIIIVSTTIRTLFVIVILLEFQNCTSRGATLGGEFPDEPHQLKRGIPHYNTYLNNSSSYNNKDNNNNSHNNSSCSSQSGLQPSPKTPKETTTTTSSTDTTTKIPMTTMMTTTMTSKKLARHSG